jgi:hypothetical protein
MTSESVAAQLDRLGDYRIESMGWAADGNDFLITLVSADREDKVGLRFIWATKICIQMDFGEYSGMPLLFGAEAVPTGNGYRVEFQCGVAPEGGLSLLCNDIQRS